MEELGGWLHVESALGHGTTVTLGLPFTSAAVSPPESSADEGQVSSPEARTAGVRRLLLVDDHAMVRQGLRAILDHYPDLVIIGEAADGREAVSIVNKRAPDVVIMDINMPRMDGIEATKRIKKDHPATVIIAVSVNDTPQVRESMQRAGASAFLSKEEAGERLYETIVSIASGRTDWPLPASHSE
jgi:DNA-binding NarL/FixJ family response regulator